VGYLEELYLSSILLLVFGEFVLGEILDQRFLVGIGSPPVPLPSVPVSLSPAAMSDDCPLPSGVPVSRSPAAMSDDLAHRVALCEEKICELEDSFLRVLAKTGGVALDFKRDRHQVSELEKDVAGQFAKIDSNFRHYNLALGKCEKAHMREASISSECQDYMNERLDLIDKKAENRYMLASDASQKLDQRISSTLANIKLVNNHVATVGQLEVQVKLLRDMVHEVKASNGKNTAGIAQSRSGWVAAAKAISDQIKELDSRSVAANEQCTLRCEEIGCEMQALHRSNRHDIAQSSSDWVAAAKGICEGLRELDSRSLRINDQCTLRCDEIACEMRMLHGTNTAGIAQSRSDWVAAEYAISDQQLPAASWAVYKWKLVTVAVTAVARRRQVNSRQVNTILMDVPYYNFGTFGDCHDTGHANPQ
jgi:hypothetical protein